MFVTKTIQYSRQKREYINVITIKERIKVPWVSCAALRYEYWH
nr:MAG TPA: hypothetical protein [Caudoviricetes sp.]